MRNLSKSKILACRQCPKRLWLELHKPELRDDSASKMAFAIGNRVGEVARDVFDPDGTGVFLDIGELGHGEAIAQSAVLLQKGNGPIFEAGLCASGALAYADVMLPERSDGTLRWDMIEVKSSASVKDYQRDDIAVQSFIAAEAGVPLHSVSLAHINTQFVFPGGGDYNGLFQVVDLSEEARERHPEVREWLEQAHETAKLPAEPEISVGDQCTHPFTCGFYDYCHDDAPQPDYPLSSLPNLRAKRRAEMEESGIEDLRDVSDELLNELQQRVKKASTTGKTYFDAAGAAADLEGHGFPAYFLDFETMGFAVPLWPGTRPYQQIPFQFSLHVIHEDGGSEHHGFLNLDGNDPSETCARELVRLCGDTGPVFVYNATFESSVIRKLAERFPEFAAPLTDLVSRIVDLHPIARRRYYHPSQHGRWSLKSVLPALCPDLRYDDLIGVQDGMMAQQAYEEAIAPGTTPERKAELHQQLHEYCKLDTWAMVRIWQVFTGRMIKDSLTP